MKHPDIWFVCFVISAILYIITGIAVIASRLLYDRNHAIADRLAGILKTGSGSEAISPYCQSQANVYLSSFSVRRIKRILTENVLLHPIKKTICSHLLDRIGINCVQKEAMTSTRSRNPWKQIAALQILAYGRTESAWIALEKALISPYPYLIRAAITILGNLNEPRAAELLIKAMRNGSYPASRISTFLDRYLLDLSQLEEQLLVQDDPNIRYWGAILLRRYPGLASRNKMLASLTRDVNPLVRRAAIESLSLIGSDLVSAEATRLLSDAVFFVRAHAARALGTLQALEAAPAVASLLTDREWWVRYAAKTSLETMGSQAIPDILPYLKHQDRFARNGAAEVLQNLGYFEQLLSEELAAPGSPERRALLGQLAQAGGARMADAIIQRLPLEVRDNASTLFISLGMEYQRGKQ